MRLLLILCVLSGCSARIETARSLANAKEAAAYLESSTMDASTAIVARSIIIAVDPALDYLSHDWKGTRQDIKATATRQDWQVNQEAAREKVTYQAAKAQALVDAEFKGRGMYWGWFTAGISLLFGASGLTVLRKISNLKGALGDAIKFGNEALQVNPQDAEAVEQVKQRAIARKAGTAHQQELDNMMVKVRNG